MSIAFFKTFSLSLLLTKSISAPAKSTVAGIISNPGIFVFNTISFKDSVPFFNHIYSFARFFLFYLFQYYRAENNDLQMFGQVK